MRVPALGESVVSVTLSKWLKPDGSMVSRDEPICEFETEKATQELGAENAGKLIWSAKEGDDLAIGALFAKIDTAASAGASASAPATFDPSKIEQRPASTAASASYASGHPSPAAAKSRAMP